MLLSNNYVVQKKKINIWGLNNILTSLQPLRLLKSSASSLNNNNNNNNNNITQLSQYTKEGSHVMSPLIPHIEVRPLSLLRSFITNNIPNISIANSYYIPSAPGKWCILKDKKIGEVKPEL